MRSDVATELARRRLRGDRLRLQGRLDRVPQPAQAAAGRRGPAARRLRDLAARAQGARGQGPPGRVRRVAVDAVGLGRAAHRPRQPALGAVSPRLGARPLPDRHGAAGGGRRGLGRRRARLPVRAAAARRRLVPPELAGRRRAEVEGAADGPGRPADRARVAARAQRRTRLAPHPQGGRLHRRARPAAPSRTAGRTRRLLAGHDRGRGRRARVRGRDRARQRRRRARHDLSQVRGLVGRQGPALDRDHQRAVLRTPPTTCA